jgi:hypothetical protein
MVIVVVPMLLSFLLLLDNDFLLSSLKNISLGLGTMAQVVECLPSKCNKALSSKPEPKINK